MAGPPDRTIPTNDLAVLGFCELWGLIFGLPPGEDLYHGAPVTARMVAFLIIGGAFALFGPSWPWIKSRFPRRFSVTFVRTASDFRWWVVVLLIWYVFGGSVPPFGTLRTVLWSPKSESPNLETQNLRSRVLEGDRQLEAWQNWQKQIDATIDTIVQQLPAYASEVAASKAKCEAKRIALEAQLQAAQEHMRQEFPNPTDVSPRTVGEIRYGLFGRLEMDIEAANKFLNWAKAEETECKADNRHVAAQISSELDSLKHPQLRAPATPAPPRVL